MDKHTKIFLIGFVGFVVILVATIVLSFSLTIPKEESDSKKPTANILITSTVTNEYCEGDEDLNYNYITNPEVFQSDTFPYVAIIRVNDELNEYLQSLGYVSEALEIQDFTEETFSFKFFIELSNGNKVFCTYSIKTSSFSFIHQIY